MEQTTSRVNSYKQKNRIAVFCILQFKFQNLFKIQTGELERLLGFPNRRLYLMVLSSGHAQAYRKVPSDKPIRLPGLVN